MHGGAAQGDAAGVQHDLNDLETVQHDDTAACVTMNKMAKCSYIYRAKHLQCHHNNLHSRLPNQSVASICALPRRTAASHSAPLQPGTVGILWVCVDFSDRNIISQAFNNIQKLKKESRNAAASHDHVPTKNLIEVTKAREMRAQYGQSLHAPDKACVVLPHLHGIDDDISSNERKDYNVMLGTVVARNDLALCGGTLELKSQLVEIDKGTFVIWPHVNIRGKIGEQGNLRAAMQSVRVILRNNYNFWTKTENGVKQLY